ncbi:hypothetical protein NUV26_15810 [Burkholderia pseudomultivorans]|nr:hypothetical protein [Burkholderia pseudomultivorans]MDS0793632.1 hypothetical protein [Burkholderia pseudomultivorans]
MTAWLTAGTVVYLSPGVTVNVVKGLSVYALVQKPEDADRDPPATIPIDPGDRRNMAIRFLSAPSNYCG